VVHLRHEPGIYRSSRAPARFCYQIISFLPQLSPQGNSSTGAGPPLEIVAACPDRDRQMVRIIACRNENFTTTLPPVAIADVRTWPPCREGGPAPRPHHRSRRVAPSIRSPSAGFRPALCARRRPPVFQGGPATGPRPSKGLSGDHKSRIPQVAPHMGPVHPSGTDSPEVADDLAHASALCLAFEERDKGKLAGLTSGPRGGPRDRRIQSIDDLIGRIASFATPAC
jgi:hypothetical protein